MLLRDGLKALGADGARLGLLDADGERVVLADQVGGGSDRRHDGLAGWQTTPLDADLPMSVAIRKLKASWSPTAAELRDRFPALAEARSRIAALAVLPLVIEGSAIGAVSFSFCQPRHFTDEERAFGRSIVQQIAHAIEQARVHEAEQRARRRLSFLARASELLTESLELRPMLQRLAELSVRHLADWCAIDLAEPYGGVEGSVVAHLERNRVALLQDLRRRYPPDTGAPSGPGKVIRTGESELFPETTGEMLAEGSREEEHLRMLRELGIASAMVVPIAARGRIRGALTFVATDRSRSFGPEDLELAEDLARRAALAIETSLRFEREHETALTLQRALLPGSLPHVEGVEVATRYLPAEAGLEVGGDWFDVIETRAGRLDMVIGDVAGRGAHAAAVMGQLATTMHAFVLDGRPPEAAVAGLDQLMKDFDPPQMSTVLTFSLDLSSGRSRFVRAGHPPPLLRLADGEVVELTGEVSPPAGLLPGARFVTNTTKLPQGSTLLLYTDGLIERRRLDLQRGLDQLKAAFAAASDGPDSIVEVLPGALDAERVPDDIALVAVRFNGTAGNGAGASGHE